MSKIKLADLALASLGLISVFALFALWQFVFDFENDRSYTIQDLMWLLPIIILMLVSIRLLFIVRRDKS